MSGGKSPQISKTADTAAKADMAFINCQRKLLNVRERRVVSVVGVPYGLGQPQRGVEDGPAAIRAAGLKKIIDLTRNWTLQDCGDVESSKVTDADEGQSLFLNGADIGAVCESLSDLTWKSSDQGHFTLTLGGDHGIAKGSISGLLRTYPDLCVIWVDAHGDCNTPDSSPSGNYHGMPLAHLMRWFGGSDKARLKYFEWDHDVPKLPENRVAIIGLRDVDESEKEMLRNSKTTCFCMSKVDRMGIYKTIKKAIKAVDPEGIRPLHLSFDIDSCDPTVAPGTGTLARGGLTYREAHLICEVLSETGRLVSMDVVEVNPSIEANMHGSGPVPVAMPMHGDRLPPASCDTAKLAAELVGSALGLATL